MSEDEILLTHILQCKPIDLIIQKPRLTPAQQDQFNQYKIRRQTGEPLQYILGTWNFMGLELEVNSATLIPRPETEQLVDHALQYLLSAHIFQPNILDLGAGSGNIAIALAKHVPAAEVISIDISSMALEVARTNAKRHGVEEHVHFIQADMLGPLQAVIPGTAKQSFDLIISNPPYIPHAQLRQLPLDVQQEPSVALDGGKDGLIFYRSIIKNTPHLLRSEGCLMMEFGDDQADDVYRLADQSRFFSQIKILKDLADRDRIILAIRK